MLVRNPRGLMARLIMIVAALGLFAVGYYWGNQYKYGKPSPPAIEGVLIQPPPELPGFELHDAQGQAFTAASFNEHWTLLAFGDLALAPGHQAITRMIEVYNRLAQNPELQDLIQLVVVEEHQNQALAQDFGRLTEALMPLSGDPGELGRLRASLGASAGESKGSNEGPDAAPPAPAPLFLIGPEGRLLALFPNAQPAASIAADLAAIAKHPHAL